MSCARSLAIVFLHLAAKMSHAQEDSEMATLLEYQAQYTECCSKSPKEMFITPGTATGGVFTENACNAAIAGTEFNQTLIDGACTQYEAAFALVATTTPPPTPVPPTPAPPTPAPSPLPTPNMNDGQWSIPDVMYYRRSVTQASKAKLMELMGMNETNETELLLVTPLSEAPTPAPPTPAPTPVPETVVSAVRLQVPSASAFNETAFRASAGLSPDAVTVTTFTVALESSINPAPTEAQALAIYEEVFAIPQSDITVTITPTRRLQSGGGSGGAVVAASAVTSDAGVADAAVTAGSDPEVLKQKAQSAAGLTVETAIVTAPAVEAKVEIQQTVADKATAQNLADTLTASINNIDPASVGASSVAATTVVQQVPTPAPTKIPTATPTTLPAGFTLSPTAMPTAMPTKMPTAMPTNMPTAMPTAMPTKMPTAMPTATPTKTPTATPTKMPTASPTATPTKTPTASPTPVPPTSAPTMSPTNATAEEESEAHFESMGMITAAVVAFASIVA